jgi:hypothetical protein
MPSQPRLTGEPILRILCRNSDKVVGYLYHFNNGELLPMWLSGPATDVRYEPIIKAA